MGDFTNQATLSYNHIQTNSNKVKGNLREVLGATKTAVDQKYAPGGSITYLISLVNTGATPVSGLTVTDNLGAYTFGTTTVVPLTYVADSITYYENGIRQAVPTVLAGPPLVIRGISVPAGGNTMLAYETTVNRYTPLAQASRVVNTAVIDSTTLAAPVNVTETVTALDTAQLSISKWVSPDSVVDGDTLTYTFVLQNTGNTATATADQLVITDIFNPVLSDLKANLNGTPLTLTTHYTYNTTTGAFDTKAGAIGVPAATYTQDTTTGKWTTVPGVSVLTVTGTV